VKVIPLSIPLPLKLPLVSLTYPGRLEPPVLKSTTESITTEALFADPVKGPDVSGVVVNLPVAVYWRLPLTTLNVWLALAVAEPPYGSLTLQLEELEATAPPSTLQVTTVVALASDPQNTATAPKNKCLFNISPLPKNL
jgi:hypothetical protein